MNIKDRDWAPRGSRTASAAHLWAALRLVKRRLWRRSRPVSNRAVEFEFDAGVCCSPAFFFVLEEKLRTRWMVIIALLTLSGLAPIHAATAPKIGQIGTFDEAGVPDALKKVLEPKGYRITLEDGSEWCKIWLRDGVPASGKSEVEGALFPQLAESTLI